MKRLLLDTNIYISAILFGGKPREILNLARSGKIEVIISEYILWELSEVLRHKFRVPDSRLNIIEHDILSLAKLIKVFSGLGIIAKDPSDNAILACALDGKADLIVTGDNHFLKLKKYRNIQILTTAEFLRKR